MIRPELNCSGVVGVVGVLITTFAFPAQMPLTEITSPLCTSEKLTLPLLLMLCMLINTPLRKSTAVACPMPLVKVKATSTDCDCGASSASGEPAVSPREDEVMVLVLVLVFVEGIDLVLGFAFFEVLAMGWCLMMIKATKDNAY